MFIQIRSGIMSIEKTIQVQPVKLTQKLGRYTKGLMISAAIILVAAILTIVGIMHNVDIIMKVGFVIVSLSSIIFLVFFVLYLTSNKRLGRTNEVYSKKQTKSSFHSSMVFSLVLQVLRTHILIFIILIHNFSFHVCME